MKYNRVPFTMVEEQPVKKEGEFSLIPDGNGNLDLLLRTPDDRDDDGWFVLRINRNGTITLHPGVPDDIGLKVDGVGRVKIATLE